MEYSSIFVCLMGMGTVFFGLICLIALTYLMSAVVGRGKKAAPAPVPAAPQTAGEVTPELVAAVSAVLAEIPRVRKDFGYPPLVTPTSQIVGTQAVMNVIVGKYKTFPKESKGLLRGEYGALPGEVNPEVRALAGIDPEEVITCRPADNIAPELETYKEQFKDIAKSEEDVLSLALFPQVAPKFLAWRDGPHEAPAQPAEAPKAPPADPNAVRELFVEYKF